MKQLLSQILHWLEEEALSMELVGKLNSTALLLTMSSFLKKNDTANSRSGVSQSVALSLFDLSHTTEFSLS